VRESTTCYRSVVVSTIDRLSDLAPERVRPLRRVEYERLVAEGLFGDERIELLGGVIVEMSPQDPRHAAVIQRLDAALGPLAHGRAALRVQLPFAASPDSLPEPDVALVPPGDYDDAHPDRALLIIEVANASLRKDRLLKAELYARAGVPEYWIVNLVDRRVEVHTGPGDGAYAQITFASPGDALTIAELGGAAIAVGDFLR
jgi:Uma2 family endonuclease